jgi:hypothetical protein
MRVRSRWRYLYRAIDGAQIRTACKPQIVAANKAQDALAEATGVARSQGAARSIEHRRSAGHGSGQFPTHAGAHRCVDTCQIAPLGFTYTSTFPLR